MSQDADNPKLEPTYPCPWEYRIIGSCQHRLRQAVGQVVRDLPHTLEPANTSRFGKYCSLRLAIAVADETQRIGIYEALRGHPDVRMVL